MNPVRVGYVRDKVLEVMRDELDEREAEERAASARPFDGLRVLDVGCGGGLLTEVCIIDLFLCKV